MLALPVDCLGDFGPRRLYVQYTHDIHGCPPAHIGRLWLSMAVCQHTQDVCGCPCVSLTSVAVRDCPSAHTGRLWLSVCDCGCPSPHTGNPWLSISTHISLLVLGLSTLVLPVDCLGDFGPRGLSVQYTQNVCGCPSAHTGRPCVSVSTHRTSVAVCVCTLVSVNTHRTSVAVHQYTCQHVGPWTQHADPSCGLFGTSVGVRQHTQDVRGCPCVYVCVRLCPSAHIGCLWLSITRWPFPLTLGDFGPRGLSGQYTQDICGCPPAHTGRMWLYVAVRQHTQDVNGCPCVSACVCVCPSAHQDVCGCPSVHTGRPCVSVSTQRTSVAVRVCPSAHTRCPWLSISTHISTLVLGLSTLALPVDCLGDFGPRGLSVQYTQDVCGCLRAHTGRPWLSVAVCGCPSAHTGRLWLSVCARVCPSATQDVRGCPSVNT
ncbi:hypothetical protein IGI04_036372 [Brassica rapa subsp. trilocularis]|uniref:Uncharacterized protein n=1 Tax=Brassica rapa subsp. trilocularis TaxID=1813537 RepID=A0ABQ7LE95_BRACM|nr:hypothetical protein IGI04_036372 [Brassica rapa subsp. trilocularis]